MTNLKRGFTLIELLVVIAIIGILAAIVLTNLGTARTKARAASAIASMSATRAEAEMGVDSAGTYVLNICGTAGDATTNCSGTGCLDTLITAVETQLGSATAVSCGQNTLATARPNSWAASALIATGDYFCVDSTGFAGGKTSVSISSGYVSTDLVC